MPSWTGSRPGEGDASWRGPEGPTDVNSLLLVCTFHHKLVHEWGWTVWRETDGAVHWFNPDGTRYRAGPGPPLEAVESEPALSAVGA